MKLNRPVDFCDAGKARVGGVERYGLEGEALADLPLRRCDIRRRVREDCDFAGDKGSSRLTQSEVGHVRLAERFKRLQRPVVMPGRWSAPQPATTSPSISSPSGALGISWGGTINETAQNLARRNSMDNRVVLLCSGGWRKARLSTPTTMQR
ncbi:hypothetical protein [Pseudolabrys sp. FHR47]|uniref:hypothetical protein n=1 Tax=Pseudolabrys sp. FHR47 TaxID=2562284 RepID=UPI0010BE1D4C|nr:hypothetical protein [Pseudolabrys sp. FHR47]